MRLILLRHGQTEWNRVERFRGRKDLSLNDTGVRQAQAIAESLAAWPVAAVYSSPLKRAWQTAEVIARSQALEVRPLPDIIDVDYGEWQGLSPRQVARRFPQLFDRWLREPHQVVFPGGEVLAAVQERALAAVWELVASHPQDTIVLVSHKVICKLLVLGQLGLDASHFWKIEQDVGAMNLLEINDGMAAVRMVNDTCHLRHL